MEINIEDYIPLVLSLATQLDKEHSHNLVSVGIIMLIECSKDFDKTKKTKFSTFIYKKIKGAMLNELKRDSWFKRTKRELVMLSLDDVEDSVVVNDAEEIILEREKSGIVQELLSKLEPKDREVIKLIYWNGMTHIEVAYTLGISEGRVSQVHKSILALLKKELREYA